MKMAETDQESENPVHCMLLPTEPVALLMPSACIAEVIASPEILAKEGTSTWMAGHTQWRGQRIAVMSWEALHPGTLPEEGRRARVVVMNPMPDSVGSGFWAILCYGEIQPVAIHAHTASCDPPNELDDRYVAMTVLLGEDLAVIPDMKALGLVLTYS